MDGGEYFTRLEKFSYALVYMKLLYWFNEIAVLKSDLGIVWKSSWLCCQNTTTNWELFVLIVIIAQFLAWFSMSYCQWKPNYSVYRLTADERHYEISTKSFSDPRRLLRPFLTISDIFCYFFLSKLKIICFAQYLNAPKNMLREKLNVKSRA